MKGYFRFISVLCFISFIAGMIVLIIAVQGWKGAALAGGIIGIILCALVGPAEGLLFWKVADLLDNSEKTEKTLSEKDRQIIDKNNSFSVFEAFEFKNDYRSDFDDAIYRSGTTGVIEEETDTIYKGYISNKEGKPKIVFPKNERDIKIFKCVRTLEEIILPNQILIKKGKVGQIERTFNSGSVLVRFLIDNETVEVLITNNSLKK